MIYIDYQSMIIAFMIWRKHDKNQRLYSASSEYPAVFSYQRFSKLASVYYNKEGLHSPLLYVFLFLMIANCGIYAIAWQQVIKNFPFHGLRQQKRLSSMVPGMGCDHFHENLSLQNIIGILIVLIGVWMVQRYE